MSNDLYRASSEMELQSIIKNMQALLTDAKTELAKWQISMDVSIQQPQTQIQIAVRKPNGQGFNKVISKEQALYYAEDPNTLTDEIVAEIFEQMFKEQIKNELVGPIAKAVANVKYIAARS